MGKKVEDKDVAPLSRTFEQIAQSLHRSYDQTLLAFPDEQTERFLKMLLEPSVHDLGSC
jgi:hypothetical protein